DRRTIEGAPDLLGRVRAVVARVVPREALGVGGFVEEVLERDERVLRRRAVDGQFLPGLVGLRPTERPEEWVQECRRIAEGVARRLAVEELRLRLHVGADLREVGPARGELVPTCL